MDGRGDEGEAWMLAVKMRVWSANVQHDGNCDDTKGETESRNGEESKNGIAKQRRVTSGRKLFNYVMYNMVYNI
jgi:hypothetical protein